MERHEKVKAIIQAIDSRISRKKINPRSNGLHAGKLYKAYKAAKEAGVTSEQELFHGGKIGDNLVDRMYDNALKAEVPKVSTPTTKKPVRKKKTPSKSQKTPCKKLPPSSPPGVSIVLQKQVSQLEEQLNTTQQQVTALEEMASKTQQQLDYQKEQTMTLQETVEQLDNQRVHLQLENEKLQNELDNKVDIALDNESIIPESNTQELHGFCLTQRKAGTGLNKYWYAGKRINGKLTWIYIGPDKSKAEQKIEAWLAKQTREQAQGDLFELVDNDSR